MTRKLLPVAAAAMLLLTACESLLPEQDGSLAAQTSVTAEHTVSAGSESSSAERTASAPQTTVSQSTVSQSTASQTTASQTTASQSTASQSTASQSTVSQTASTGKTSAGTTGSTSASSSAPQTADPPPETEDWMLMLANKTHPVGEYAPPALTTLSNGTKIDSRVYPALQKMYDAMRAQGLKPTTREGYRTYADQLDIMQTRIKSYRSQGYSEQKAKQLAELYVAVPGTSEHQLGLAVDVNSTDGNNWLVYNWLAAHASEYGFILRYPVGKQKVTGYAYEAWHYRYVGEKAAKEITKRCITLEEYLGET